MSNGNSKIVADVPAGVKSMLEDLAHADRSNKTQMLIKLIEEKHKGLPKQFKTVS